MRAMWFGTRSSSRSLRPISITSPGTRQRHHPTVDMGYRTRYLQMAARMRARFSKTSVSFRRRLVAAVMFVFLVVIMSIEISPFGYLVEVGKPSKRTIIAPRTVQYVDLSLIHISEPTRLGMISYAVFCLKKKNTTWT